VMARSKRQRIFIGCSLVAGLLILIVGGLAAWSAWMAKPVDKLARVRALPVYPGASSVQVQMEQRADGPVGVLSFETGASIDDMFAYYDPALTAAGWQKVVGESDGGTGLYTQPEGSFQGIELTAGSGAADSGFPWFRIDRNRAPLWLHLGVSQVYHGGQAWTHVDVELTQP
jgi:hypothetical protein